MGVDREAYGGLLGTLADHGQVTAHLSLDAAPAVPHPVAMPTRAPLSQLSRANDGGTSALSQPTAASLPATQECATQPLAHGPADAVRQVRSTLWLHSWALCIT